MAARHDRRNRPVGNALLKWQLQQDQRRIAEVQRRLMRMAAPSPASSLGMDSIGLDRRPTARRPRPMQREDPEEDALMHLIMEREQREAASSNQSERPGVKPSRLPPLKQNLYPKPPHNTPVKNVSLRPTGQKLNAAGDFYSPVRPREAALSSSSSEFRQNLAFSRIKAPAPKRLVGRTAAPSPRNPLRYDQMKTPDRWRTTAMRSNQEELNESALKRWEQEDAMQADRLLEKAAREGDDEPLWEDIFYGTKATRAKTNQPQNDPEQPVVYSTSSFPEVFLRGRRNSHGSSCYEVETDQPRSPLKAGIDDHASDLSTMSTTKPSTVQHSDVGSHVVHSTGASPVTSGQSISELLASMEKTSEIEPSARELVAGDDRGFDGSSGGGDREQLLTGEVPMGEPQCAQSGALPNEVFPIWSIVVVASCLVVGTSGFFIEKLMGLLGLFSKNAPLTLSRAEQDRMRDRVGLLQQELQGFQLSTSEIEVKSQTVVTELERHLNRMRLDREQHQNMLTTEMQELRSHILHITQDIVEKERQSIQAQLEEMVKVQVINEAKAVDKVESESAKQVEETSPGEPALTEPKVSSAETRTVDELGQDKQLRPEEAQDETHQAVAAVQVSSQVDGVPAHTGHGITGQEQELKPVVAPLASVPEVSEPQAQPEDIKVVRVEEVVVLPAPAPALDEVVHKIDVSVAPAPKLPVGTTQSRTASGMSWEGILLLIGIMFLVACVVLRVYNINRRKKWFEERRKRRTQRALRLAQLRARTMAATQDDSDEWGSEETNSVEEVALMTPVRDSEDDEASPQLQRQSPDIDIDFEDNDDEQTPHSPTGAYRVATSERSASTQTRSKSYYRRSSPLHLRQRSPRPRRQHNLAENLVTHH